MARYQNSCAGTFFESEEAPQTACPGYRAAAASRQPIGNEPMPLPAPSFPISSLPRRFSQRDNGGSFFSSVTSIAFSAVCSRAPPLSWLGGPTRSATVWRWGGALTMGLGCCQTSITIGFAPTTHANSPTYATIPPFTMPRSRRTLSPITRKSSITTLPHPRAKYRPNSTRNAPPSPRPPTPSPQGPSSGCPGL